MFPGFDLLGLVRFQITRAHLMRDMWYLYKHMLRAHSTMVVNEVFGEIPMAVRAILHAKHLVKDYYDGGTSRDSELGLFMCTVRVLGDPRKELPTFEMVVVEPNAIVGGLKRETK